MKRAAIFLLTLLTLTPLARAADSVPFLDDDYPAALVRARAAHLPLFVEAWAPW